jgi:hypothetical protein
MAKPVVVYGNKTYLVTEMGMKKYMGEENVTANIRTEGRTRYMENKK